MNIYTSRQMQEIDRITIEEEIVPSLYLMENAAKAVVKEILKNFNKNEINRCLIVAGKGNNGGDGICVARILHYLKFSPILFLSAKKEDLSRDSKFQFENYDGEVVFLENEDDFINDLSSYLKRSKIVVDALLGTGTKGEVQGFYKKIIETINSQDTNVVSIDIPSGLSGDSFLPFGIAVRADLTVTLGGLKLPLASSECEEFCGEVIKVDIGLSDKAFEKISPHSQLIDFEFARRFFPERGKKIHKGNLGHLLIIAGGKGKLGASILTAKGALRSGAGLVTVATTKSLCPFVTASVPEVMTLPLPETLSGMISLNSYDILLKFFENVDAVAIGPGISTEEETSELSRRLYSETKMPMVVDADGLNAFSQKSDLLFNKSGERVLTPHPGEFGRLLNLSAIDVLSNRYQLVTEYAQKWGVTLLLKGYKSLIGDKKGFFRINSSGGSYMAGAGMGDVLTGIVGALLARKVHPFDSASIGAYFHGLSAELVFKKMGYGILASDVADNLPFTESLLRNGI